MDKPAYLRPPPPWAPHERPTMPGSPGMPAHRRPVRLAYALVAVLVGLTGGLGNALFVANLPSIQGDLGLTPSQGAWLPAAYLMVNVSTNLVMIKFRQQYGLRLFAEIGLGVYALLTVAHVVVEGFAMAVLVRGASGFAGAILSALTVLYMLQAFSRANTGRALVLALGLSQLATPLAWLLSPALLDLGEWHRLYAFEAGLALCALAAVVLLKLPVGEHIRAFEPLDFLSFALLAPALALFAAVLAQGRLQWWTAQPWLGWALVAGWLLLLAAFAIEHHRRRPLLQTRWLGTAGMLRFAFGAIALRFILAEQSYGAVGLLQTLGMGPDQLRPLFAVILLGLLLGIAASALTFAPATILPQILLALLLIGAGSFMDDDATSQTRPQDLFVSQGILSFAAGLFLGPLMLTGFRRALASGPGYLVSYIVLFSFTQSLGGLAGPALLGTFQTVREQYHSAILTEQLVPADPAVTARLRQQGQPYAARTADAARAEAQGATQLQRTLTREANVLAFNDVFRLTGVLALAVFGWSLFHTLRLAREARRTPPPTGPAAP